MLKSLLSLAIISQLVLKSPEKILFLLYILYFIFFLCNTLMDDRKIDLKSIIILLVGLLTTVINYGISGLTIVPIYISTLFLIHSKRVTFSEKTEKVIINFISKYIVISYIFYYLLPGVMKNYRYIRGKFPFIGHRVIGLNGSVTPLDIYGGALLIYSFCYFRGIKRLVLVILSSSVLVLTSSFTVGVALIGALLFNYFYKVLLLLIPWVQVIMSLIYLNTPDNVKIILEKMTTYRVLTWSNYFKNLYSDFFLFFLGNGNKVLTENFQKYGVYFVGDLRNRYLFARNGYQMEGFYFDIFNRFGIIYFIVFYVILLNFFFKINKKSTRVLVLFLMISGIMLDNGIFGNQSFFLMLLVFALKGREEKPNDEKDNIHLILEK